MNNDQSGPWTTSPQPIKAYGPAVLANNNRNLYSDGKEAGVRETLQNQLDACAARRVVDPHTQSVIECEQHATSDGCWVLTMQDNGIGMHPNEAEWCLATIGGSETRGRSHDLKDVLLRGQFGNGSFAASLLFTKEVTVISQKLTLPGEEDALPFRWVGYPDGTWELHPVTERIAVGTSVSGTLPAECTPEWTFEKMRKFVGYATGARIVFRARGSEHQVNEAPPWARNLTEDELLELGREMFKHQELVGAFTFGDEATGTRGAGFISGLPAMLYGPKPLHTLSVRGILVSDKVLGLEPDDMPYVRVQADSERLQLNISREQLHGEEEGLESVREAVGMALSEYLGWLAKAAPERLTKIVLQQREAMLAGVEAGHTALLPHLTRAIPLHTTLGYSTYDQILRRHGRVEYVEDERDWHRVEMKAKQEGHCLVRADYRDTNQLLKAIRQHWHGAPVTALSAADYLARFALATETHGAEEQRLMGIAGAELRTEQCRLAFADSDDPYEIALLEMEDEESILRHLHASDQEEESPVETVKTLRLNRSHPLVEKLLAGPDLPEEQFRAWLRLIYHHSLLTVRETPTGGECRRQARALMVLFNATGGSF
jgi:molecular chaperone HtpG